MSAIVESWPVRVYYEDTDHGGVVYYANYLKFMERARSEFLRVAGLELDAIEAEFGVMFAVREAHISYRTPARFNEMLSVESRLVTMRGARIEFRQEIYRGQESDGDHTLLCSGDIELACIDRDGRVRKIPAAVLAQLANYLNPKKPNSTEPIQKEES